MEICFVFTIDMRGLCHVVSLDKGLVIFCSFLYAAVTADSCEDLYVAVLETIKDCLQNVKQKVRCLYTRNISWKDTLSYHDLLALWCGNPSRLEGVERLPLVRCRWKHGNNAEDATWHEWKCNLLVVEYLGIHSSFYQAQNRVNYQQFLDSTTDCGG